MDYGQKALLFEEWMERWMDEFEVCYLKNPVAAGKRIALGYAKNEFHDMKGLPEWAMKYNMFMYLDDETTRLYINANDSGGVFCEADTTRGALDECKIISRNLMRVFAGGCAEPLLKIPYGGYLIKPGLGAGSDSEGSGHC